MADQRYGRWNRGRGASIAVLVLGASAFTTPAAAVEDTFTVDTTSDTVDASPGDGTCADAAGACSLRAAVMESNALGGHHDIELDGSATHRLTRGSAGEDAAAGGDLDVLASIALHANGATIDGASADRILDLHPGGTLVVDRAVLQHGQVRDAAGGAIRSNGVLQVHDTTIQDSRATGDGASGGALFAASGRAEVTGGVFRRNTATQAGGAIEVGEASPVTLTGTRILANRAGDARGGDGGGLHVTDRVMTTLVDVVIERNTAAGDGGGIWDSSPGQMQIFGGRIRHNVAGGDGGGIFDLGEPMSIEGTLVARNQAGDGGGLFLAGTQLSLVDVLVQRNEATGSGGGMHALQAGVTVDGGTFQANTAQEAGAAYANIETSLAFAGTKFFRNVAATQGGAIVVGFRAGARLVDTLVINNTAGTGGGGIASLAGGVSMTGGNLAGNRVTDGAGGGILVLGYDAEFATGGISVRNATIGRNHAPVSGGGIEVGQFGFAVVDGTTIRANTTGDGPGNGGGVHVATDGTLDLGGSKVLANAAANEGGGVRCASEATTTIDDTAFDRNTAALGPDVFFAAPGQGTCTVDGVPVQAGGRAG